MSTLLLKPQAAKPLPEVLAPRDQTQAWAIIGALSLILIGVYADSLFAVADTWNTAQYSHGFLIPLGAAVMLWLRREPFRRTSSAERWAGAALIAAGLAMRVISAYYTTFTTDYISLIPCLLGVFLLVGGWRALRWAGPAIAFLIFMYPWPDALQQRVMVPLKSIATSVSLYALQTLGVEAHQSGNIIELGDGTKMNVVDACSGLRMLTIFLALAAAVALLGRTRPMWERLVVLASAVPIALVVNALRITVEGLIFYYGDALLPAESVKWLAAAFHSDWVSGPFMMLIAVGLLALEQAILQRLIIEEETGPSLRKHLPASTK
jgi:exosortase